MIKTVATICGILVFVASVIWGFEERVDTKINSVTSKVESKLCASEKQMVLTFNDFRKDIMIERLQNRKIFLNDQLMMVNGQLRTEPHNGYLIDTKRRLEQEISNIDTQIRQILYGR